VTRRSARFIVPWLLLLAGGGLGIRNSLAEWSGAATGAQHLAAATEMGYGIAGLLAAAALWVGHRRTMTPLAIWAVLITATGGMAPVVWGEAPLYTGVLAALVVAAIAVLVVWMARRALSA
jgi:hypothetical protein